MTTGFVSDDDEAIIRLDIRGPGGQKQNIEAVIDTGFTGSLSLPPAVIGELALRWRQRGTALLADGREAHFDIYEATVVWERHARRINVYAADAAPLVGMALLRGYELKMQVRTGGKVTIKSLSK
jgi:clan AA aspartic protease